MDLNTTTGIAFSYHLLERTASLYENTLGIELINDRIGR